MRPAAGHLGRYRAIASVAAPRVPPAPTRRRRVAGARRDGAADCVDAARLLRLRVYLTRGSLDREISRGVALDTTPALILRARQLAVEPTRRVLAADLRRAVEYAEHVGSRTRLSAVMLEPARVRAGRGALLRLAERLEQATPVSPQGVAMTHVLLSDAASPLFNRDSERTVTEASCIAEDALVSGTLVQPPSR
jgi:hypothetical protein